MLDEPTWKKPGCGTRVLAWLGLAGLTAATWLAAGSCCKAPPFDPGGGWHDR